MPTFLYERFHLSLAASGLTATLFVQLASLAGSPAGGWWADVLRRKMPGGRMLGQAIGLAAGAPFVVPGDSSRVFTMRIFSRLSSMSSVPRRGGARPA